MTVESSRASFESSMWLPPLQEVWKATAQLTRLGELAEVRLGIEYNIPFRQHEKELVSVEPRPGFAHGVHKVEDTVEPFLVLKTVYLNVSPELMRRAAYKLPWDQKKLIVNARRRTRGAWTIGASLDYRGIVGYRNFYGIWPNSTLSLEVCAAILYGPVANAFVATREGKRDIRIHTLRGIPVPDIHPDQQRGISSLVRRYTEAREQWISGARPPEQAHDTCARLLKLIDAEVLKAYDFSPRTERVLLDYFSGHRRPGPVAFSEYYPANFKPYIPWRLYISDDFQRARASETLKRLPVIDDPLISEALSYLYDDK